MGGQNARLRARCQG